MANPDARIRRLQLVLRESVRDPGTRTAVRQAAAELGLQLSGEGYATLSARIGEADFAALFGTADGALDVPDRLAPFVESISEAPEHLSFD